MIIERGSYHGQLSRGLHSKGEEGEGTSWGENVGEGFTCIYDIILQHSRESLGQRTLKKNLFGLYFK